MIYYRTLILASISKKIKIQKTYHVRAIIQDLNDRVARMMAGPGGGWGLAVGGRDTSGGSGFCDSK